VLGSFNAIKAKSGDVLLPYNLMPIQLIHRKTGCLRKAILNIYALCHLGNCSCVTLLPTSMQSQHRVIPLTCRDALMPRKTGCLRKVILNIYALCHLGNCSCVTLLPTSMQSQHRAIPLTCRDALMPRKTGCLRKAILNINIRHLGIFTL
jgi:hypothetical protein